MLPKGLLLKLSRLFLFFMLQVCILFILFMMFYKKQTPGLSTNLQNYVTTFGSSEPILIILLWTYPYNYRFPLNRCPKQFDGSGCFYTVNRKMYSSANAVVIHHRNVSHSKEQLPQAPRPPNQYWIWFSNEPPSHCSNLSFMDNLINLTMSYRTDSDIFTPFGWIEKHYGAVNFTIPKKTKLVAWAVSNWKRQSKRVQYYEQLKNYLHVDIYGRKHLYLTKKEQIETLSTYKFYLAFENSIHEDYISEKFWYNVLSSGCVPVVLGPPRANYERFIPGDAFIHVDDFSSPEELASYLLRLDKDEEKYKQYFNWRNVYKPWKKEISWVMPYCKICKVLKEAPSFRTIPSIEAWFK
ncbi:3-galactosyl-N-acetylglucosaminide 4-alpha-L-fucosyltransferase FUT3-like [Dendrobates tinctorius]|uniref:3-galactosyl-N-acetylglucosaminide 4-alpha-L-fucosyltransferase FUT3-like n=1 Tax=Dendrobates tinctorius TaxID=92724 RepID=UPI003CC97DC8